MEAFSSLAVAGGFMAGLGVFLALMLALANKKLYVFEDPRIGQVEDLLPKSNCGACGQAGCRDFAEKVVGGGVIPAQCTVSSPQQRQDIADLNLAADSFVQLCAVRVRDPVMLMGRDQVDDGAIRRTVENAVTVFLRAFGTPAALRLLDG